MNMKTISMKAWFVPGILVTALLAACGGGGGGDKEVAFDPKPDASLFRIANNPVETARILVVNSTGEELGAVQVLLSTLRDEELPLTSDDVIAPDTVKVSDVLLYNSNADGLPTIANNATGTFGLNNVNFAAANSNTAALTSDAQPTCADDANTLGTVRIEVFSQGSPTNPPVHDVPVCDIVSAQNTGYVITVIPSNP
jgi:hypothetical protein